jgi:hypothetical protein
MLSQSQTPKNYQEFGSQSDLIEKKILGHQGSSPTPMVEALVSLKKGILKSAKETALLREEVRHLREANETLSGRRKRKRTLLKRKEPISVAEGQEMIDNMELAVQLQREMDEDTAIVVSVTKKKRRCKTCGTLGHNSRTCKARTTEAEDHHDTQNV